mgnify:FL=1
MPIKITEEEWVPAQEKFETGEDFRSFHDMRASRKRVREIAERGDDALMEEDVDEDESMRLRKASRPTYKQVVGKASGRSWKLPAERASKIMKPDALRGIKTWDQRMKEKAAKKQFQTTIKEANDAARAARKEEHERRAKKKQQKEENRQRTGEGLYKPEITNTKTIAKRGKSKEFKKQKALKMV